METFDASEAIVWIDPLDGTRGFARGQVTVVTSLIGVSIKGKPSIGIVHRPFCENTSECEPLA